MNPRQSNFDPHRPPPTNIEAEQALIGAVLTNNNAYRRVGEIVSEKMFAEETHQKTWAVIAALCEKGQAATPITLKTYLGDADLGAGVTVMQYLINLAGSATTVINAPDYARTVRDLFYRREIIQAAKDVLDLAYDAPVDLATETLVARLEGCVDLVRPIASRDTKEFRSFDDVSNRAIDQMAEDYRNQGKLRGLSTGLRRLDEIVGGLQAPDFVVIGGRTGSGKTALAMNMATAAAMDLHRRRKEGERVGVVGFFSLEMGDTQLFDRMIASEAGVESWRIRRRKVTETEIRRIMEAQDKLKGLPLYTDDTGYIPIAQLASRARDLKKRHGLELLFIDYIQLIKGREQTGRREINRTQELTDITITIKGLAKELGIPIVALSQVGRQVDQREDHRPMLSDLRESGSIEMDSDTVIFCVREENYLKAAEPRHESERYAAWEKQMRAARGVAEIIVAKNRHGALASFQAGFSADVTKFTDEPEPREAEPEQATERRKSRLKGMPRDALILMGVLRTLSSQTGILSTTQHRQDDRRLMRGALLVSFEDARAEFAHEALGPSSSDEAFVERSFRTAVKALRANDLAHWTGNPEGGWFLWLPEKVGTRDGGS